ncbi:spatacsin isoform X2 [Neodiprion fabricii]|uniref:spatacsin isoform X2 n=1 Tax=Neodiprion fabricii TaxID=2872261 RepID=UPI001ED92779|nr:spatacsin isoform X2 [Neodiprion fabricii]
MDTVGGIPVECLTGELAGVWSGWRILGDREIVREASAKGTHINLAIKCLATRRNCPLTEAEAYFYREVDVWVKELLDKQQVFRATHILKNAGKNPKEYITVICINSRDQKLRDYLVQHLRKIDGLQASELKAWQLFNIMNDYKAKYFVEDDPITNKSIEEIIQMPEDLKIIICTDLYFHTFQGELVEYLSSQIVWDYLLMRNKVDLILFWIDINYGVHQLNPSSKDKELYEALKHLKITDNVIDSTQQSSAASITKEVVLDYLGRYGVFTSNEAVSVKHVLTRLLNNKIVPAKFEKILSQHSCNIQNRNLLSKLNIGLYSKSYLEEDHMLDVDKKIQRFTIALERVASSSASIEEFEGCILATIDYISDDAVNYLETNPLVFLSLIFLLYRKKTAQFVESDRAPHRILGDTVMNNEGVQFGSTLMVPRDVVNSILHRFPHFERAILGKTVARDSNMYQLLNGFKNFNASRSFLWRQRTNQMPTFYNEYLVKRYGHKEKLTYINYLKQGRPNMAVRLFVYDQKKFHHDISSKMKCQASTEAHILALRNITLPEITSACVSFIEAIGVDSETLRLHLTVAKRIQDQLEISAGELLESVVYKNASDLKTLSSHLEHCFKQHLKETIEENPCELITAIKDWDLNIKFAQTHKTLLPESFLEYLVQRELCFEFLLVGQIFDYPIDQMLRLVKKLANPSIKGHLLACLDNPNLCSGDSINFVDRQLKSRDSRQFLYSKIGLRNCSSGSGSPTESGSHAPGNSMESFMCLSHDDLWMAILKCHYSQDPPGSLVQTAHCHGAPFLVVLATCYEPSAIPAYWCSWLVISTNDRSIITDYKDCLDRQIWPADRVLKLLTRLVASGYTKTITKSLQIFMPENPLRLFAEFLTQCVNLGDFESGQEKLHMFKTACSGLVSNMNISWMDSDPSYLKNSYWIILASIKCATIALGYSFSSTVSQMEFIKVLCSSNFSADLPDAPDFGQLFTIMEILKDTEVSLNFTYLSSFDDPNLLEKEIQRCLAQLAQSDNYKVALRLCNALNINCSDVIIAEWRKEFEKTLIEDGQLVTKCWINCSKDFEKYHVSYETAAQFYVEFAEKVVSHKERFEILKLAHEILQGTSVNPNIKHGVEMAMWKSCILADPDTIDFNNAPISLNKLKTELMSGLSELQVCCELTEPGEKLAAEKLLERFLDTGHLGTALRIAKIFNYKHRDLQILMLCLSLAEGEVSPYELTAQQRLLLSTKPKLKNQWQVAYSGKGFPKVSSMSSQSQKLSEDETGDISMEVALEAANSTPEKLVKIDCIFQLERFTEILSHGIAAGRKVLLCYRLATHLGKSYQNLLTLTDPIAFLEEIVAGECDYKLEVIKDVVAAYNINNHQLAEFLSEKIESSIVRHIEGGHIDQPMTMWGYTLDGNFHVITELCSEPSLLGSKLLHTTTRLLGRFHGENRDASTLRVIVELLIKSHDCFTAACNMEGIASILRKSQQLANSLQNLKQWGLLVRLLTGVGRFTEMNYILQIIKENEQFEFLLTGRGLEKIPGLKTALLDFLKRNCPDNEDLFKLVAHHFCLYSEIASIWEQEAKEAIKKVLINARIECRNEGNLNPGDIRLRKNDITEKQLHLAMINYTHATEYYLQDQRKYENPLFDIKRRLYSGFQTHQDSKLSLAYQCCHLAELVALQISFLNSVHQNQQVLCVLNLGSADIDRMICNDLNFSQANILIRAYNHPVDWGSVLYAQCITRTNAKYLKDFMTINELTTAIVKDSVKRYQLEKHITKEMVENMQQLISRLKDVKCKYTLASQLGFKNVIETILGDAAVSAYLKDTVWRKGYTSTAFE